MIARSITDGAFLTAAVAAALYGCFDGLTMRNGTIEVYRRELIAYDTVPDVAARLTELTDALIVAGAEWRHLTTGGRS